GRHRPRPPRAHEETASRPRGVDVSRGPRQRGQGGAFAPPSLNSFTGGDSWGLLCDAASRFFASTSVLNGHAFDVVFLEIFAGGFRLVLVESGEARAIIGGATLIDRFGESFRAREDFRRLGSNSGEALLGGLLGGIGADLNHPTRLVLRLRRRRGRGRLCRRLGGRRFGCRRGGRRRRGGQWRRGCGPGGTGGGASGPGHPPRPGRAAASPRRP